MIKSKKGFLTHILLSFLLICVVSGDIASPSGNLINNKVVPSPSPNSNRYLNNNNPLNLNNLNQYRNGNKP